MIKREDKGQVALVLVLIMTVVSALAVSLATRSTVDTRIQQNETQSVQALINAQTGLEQMVVNPDLSYVSDTAYEATKSGVGTNGLVVGRVETGSTVELNLTGASSELTAVDVYWKPDNNDSGAQPAVFISVVNNDGTISDIAYDYQASNGFYLAGDGASQGYSYKTETSINISGVSKIRVTILRTAALVKIVPVGGSFPSQINSIRSIGSVNSGNTVVKYGLQYDESTNDVVPGVFDYALFSGGTIDQ
jgi:Tfp pilus assembly protein PilX